MAEHTITLIGTKGQRHVLACPGGPYWLGQDAGLWGKAPISFGSERLGGLDGEVIASQSVGSRPLLVPLTLNAASESELDDQLDTLGQVVHDGDCILQVATAGSRGTDREIVARYARGLDPVQQRNFDTHTVKLALQFTAFDPYWRDVANPITTIGPTTFLNAFAARMVSLTVVSTSTAPVWPQWTLTGITENIMALNLRTMQSWRMVETLDSVADTMLVNSDPRGETGAYLNGGERLWPFDAVSELWPLLPGPNPIRLSGLNSNFDSPIGSWRMDWINRYDSC